MAPQNINNVNLDVSPLLIALWQRNLLPHNVMLGSVGFGTETYHATQKVTFSATKFAMNVESGNAAELTLNSTEYSFQSRSSFSLVQTLYYPSMLWVGFALSVVLLV
jgi:hypothetical protein